MKNNIIHIENPLLTIKDLSVSYGNDIWSVKNVTAGVKSNTITAIMGPSGCGKSTLLRAINRMHELYPNTSTKGSVFLHDQDIYKLSPIQLRRKIGMVFQRPNPFPTMSISDNVLAGYKLNGIKLKKTERERRIRRDFDSAL